MMLWKGGRPSILVTVLVAALALTDSFGVRGEEDNKRKSKKCVEEYVSRGKELKQHLIENHVLVSLQKPKADGGDDDKEEEEDEAMKQYKELCQRFEATPLERIRDVEIIKVKDSTFMKKLLENSIAAPLPSPQPSSAWERLRSLVTSAPDMADKPMSLPEYIFWKKNSTLFPKDDSTAKKHGLRYVGDDKSADAVSEFLSHQLQRKKIGSFVYSLGTFDLITSNFMAIINNQSNINVDDENEDLPVKLQKYAWAYSAKFLAWMQHLSPKMPFLPSRAFMADAHGTIELGDLYVKIIFSILEKGSDYPKRQISRLEGILEKDASNLSQLKVEELQQRIYTLKKFSEPPEVTAEQTKNFIVHSSMNVGLWLAFMILLPLLFTSAEYEEDEGEGEKEEMNGTETADETDETSKKEN